MKTTNFKIALVGNPNSGKSTLFNSLTGLNQKIANFPGVTVEKRSGTFLLKDKKSNSSAEITLVDLPGTYSIYPKTPDEQIPFRILCDQNNEDHPDAVIVIADATNLKRNLFLCSQIIDLKLPVILVLNMMDMVKTSGVEINIPKLEEALGIKVIPMVARKKEGLEELKKALLEEPHIPNVDFIDSNRFAPEVVEEIKKIADLNSNYSAFQVANNFEEASHFYLNKKKKEEIKELLQREKFNPQQMQAAETLERYKVISLLMKSCVTEPQVEAKRSFTRRLDRLLMHHFWGYAIFLLIMFLIFQGIFNWAQVPMDFIDQWFAITTKSVQEFLPQGIINDLLTNGVMAGLGGIIIFIPQIALLFLFIAILEDTGYMARVSFIMDKLMRRFGLNGRSVIPLISGIACAVPAILSTRTIQSRKERIITILVTPLMSCSARLPVYTLLISLIIPKYYVLGFLNIQGIVMMSLYLIGFFAAIGSAFIMKWWVKTKEKNYFIMEMPVYRSPRWQNIFLLILEKIKIFLFDAGKVIIAISVILWFLSSRGPGDQYNRIEKQYAESKMTSMPDHETQNQLLAQKLEASYAGKLGKLIEPAITPLGFDWKIGIALITSFAAREVFVGTMATIYSVGSDSEEATIKNKMMAEKNEIGEPRYNVAVGWSLMLFYAFAMQCMSTLAVVKRETGGWKWPIIQFFFMAALAYLSSLIAYQLLK